MSTVASPQFPKEQSESGEFVRQQDAFRKWITPDPNSEFPPEPDRYHLYVSWACPWAHRTIIVRHLKGLQKLIGMSVVDPVRDEKGWAFRDVPGASRDPINGFHYLSEAYLATDPGYQGRVTVPVLWDKKTGQIVSNSDDDLMRMLNSAFNVVTGNQLDLYPPEYRTEIDALNETIYETVNNGVYRAGFATSQPAYETAAGALFKTLDELDDRLATQRFLFGTQPLETDLTRFTTDISNVTSVVSSITRTCPAI
jgi:putative glutathione S-transferase